MDDSTKKPFNTFGINDMVGYKEELINFYSSIKLMGKNDSKPFPPPGIAKYWHRMLWKNRYYEDGIRPSTLFEPGTDNSNGTFNTGNNLITRGMILPYDGLAYTNFDHPDIQDALVHGRIVQLKYLDVNGKSFPFWIKGGKDTYVATMNTLNKEYKNPDSKNQKRSILKKDIDVKNSANCTFMCGIHTQGLVIVTKDAKLPGREVFNNYGTNHSSSNSDDSNVSDDEDNNSQEQGLGSGK